jgi:hypothetical protein
MKTYSYDGLIAVLLAIGRLFGAVFAILGLCVIAFAVSVFFQNSTTSGVLCFGLIWGLGAIIGGSFFILNYPEVTVDKKGVSFKSWPFPPFSVPWSEILEVYEKSGLKRNVVFVSVRGAFPLHFLYGLYYIHRLQPGFLVRREIREFDELVKTLRNKSI